MIATMIMDMTDEITMEGSDNDQQRDRPDKSGRFFIYLYLNLPRYWFLVLQLFLLQLLPGCLLFSDECAH